MKMSIKKGQLLRIKKSWLEHNNVESFTFLVAEHGIPKNSKDLDYFLEKDLEYSAYQPDSAFRLVTNVTHNDILMYLGSITLDVRYKNLGKHEYYFFLLADQVIYCSFNCEYSHYDEKLNKYMEIANE